MSSVRVSTQFEYSSISVRVLSEFCCVGSAQIEFDFISSSICAQIAQAGPSSGQFDLQFRWNSVRDPLFSGGQLKFILRLEGEGQRSLSSNNSNAVRN